MVLSHFLSLLFLICKTGEFDYSHRDFECFRKKVFKTADSPAQRHFSNIYFVEVVEIVLNG